MTWWADASARARGLSTHLLDDAGWRRVRSCTDLPALCREIGRYGYPVQAGAAPRNTERVLEQVRSERQAVLARWLGPRTRCLRVHLEADDFRAVRALLRAADQPEDVLANLSMRGRPLAAVAREERRTLSERWPDLPLLFALEQSLLRAFARRALEGARHGGRGLVRRVRRAIDVTNARAALTIGPAGDLPAAAVFVEGGDALTLDLMEDALTAGDAGAVRARLAGALPADLGGALADARLPTPRLGRALLARELMAEHRAARRDPMGPAPVLEFLVRQRLEVHDLRGLLWARALGAPLDPERWA